MVNPPRKPGRPKGSKSKPAPKPKTAPRGLKTLHQTEKAGKFAPRANYKKRGAHKIYDPIFAEQAKALYEHGATNIEVAEFFNISTKTLQRWLVEIPEFRLQAYLGHDAADKARLHRVKASLYNRAVGYTFEAEKVAINTRTGAVYRASYLEHVPPDIQAALKWLINRDPENWREKVETHHTGEITLLDMVRASFEVQAPQELPPPAADEEKD
jgi:hypothetical protein